LTRLAYTRYSKLSKHRGRTQELEPEAFERLPDQSDFRDTLSVTNEVLVALARIPESAARVLRLQFLEGKTQEEIAEIEGSSVSAIKTRVHRAKKLFKQAHTTKKRTPSAAIMENDAWSIQTMATHGAGEEAYIIEKGGKARRVYAL
jgi:DNA-directed RNA polymerase specialized sigma24 family protein